MDEMVRRGYSPDTIWRNPCYRGKTLPMEWDFADPDFVDDQYCYATKKGGTIFPEHNQSYLRECIELLHTKEAEMDWTVVDKLLEG
jgi:uncharacterized protein (TIGR02328 family)